METKSTLKSRIEEAIVTAASESPCYDLIAGRAEQKAFAQAALDVMAQPTDAMVERALLAYHGIVPDKDPHRDWHGFMRKALQAAMEGDKE